MSKVGRNDPCPCGSGIKFKKCCKDKLAEDTSLALAIARLQARQQQIEKQQGLGRSIISIDHQGYRFVAVGSDILYSKKWKTFPDFLADYLKKIFGEDWGRAELLKPKPDRHPIFYWMELTHEHLKKYRTVVGEIFSAPMIGANFAFLNLSYNLYLLAHNAEVQKKLIERLKNPTQFEAALYETYVAAIFIKAGFTINIENEADVTADHSEFVATAPKTQKKYNVEAKHRKPGKKNVAVGNQLYDALKKDLSHERVIFIDVNIPRLLDNIESIIKELDDKEKITIKGFPAPPAYVFITNHSFSYDLDGTTYETTGFAHGFKIPDFRIHTSHTSLREALNARKKHVDMDELATSIKEHRHIPTTFDGEIPLFAFDPKARIKRWLIGKSYFVPEDDGAETLGTLESASVLEAEKRIYGIFTVADERRIICTIDMNDEELAAYKEHPDTFFGVPLNQAKQISDPLELYDLFYNTYKQSPKERLLAFMKDQQDIEHLRSLSREELLEIYCEGLVYGALVDSKPATEDKK